MADRLTTETRRIRSGLAAEIETLFAEMWKVPELPALEYKSQAIPILCDFIERRGFAVERGVGGVPNRRKPGTAAATTISARPIPAPALPRQRR